MKGAFPIAATLAALLACAATAVDTPTARASDSSAGAESPGRAIRPPEKSPDLDLAAASVRHVPELGILVFEVRVVGTAGGTVPKPAGQMDGAPVLGYVFPTSLRASQVGFGDAKGIVALAITSHPDFDDTPLFDENGDREYDDDGVVWHPHWVLLGEDERVAGGLSVRQFDPKDETVTMPPTNPGMPMYMDSPGFGVVTKGDALRVVVPVYRVSNTTRFEFDAVSAYMQVNTSDDGRPLLGVYEVYEVLSGDLSLPYSVVEGWSPAAEPQ